MGATRGLNINTAAAAAKKTNLGKSVPPVCPAISE